MGTPSRTLSMAIRSIMVHVTKRLPKDLSLAGEFDRAIQVATQLENALDTRPGPKEFSVCENRNCDRYAIAFRIVDGHTCEPHQLPDPNPDEMPFPDPNRAPGGRQNPSRVDQLDTAIMFSLPDGSEYRVHAEDAPHRGTYLVVIQTGRGAMRIEPQSSNAVRIYAPDAKPPKR